MTKYVFVGLLTLQFAIPSSYMGTSSVADASIRSAVSSVLGIEATAAQTEIGTNSQKMPLLEAPLNAVITANPTSSSIVGNTALIAVSSPTPSLATTTKPLLEPQRQTKIISYKVKAGDTVSGIAQDFGISAKTIIFANNLPHENTVREGQTLVILPISGIKHVVKSGETVSGIAAQYKGDAQEIISYNNIQGEKLISGETIIVPDGELAYTPPASKPVVAAVKKVASAALGVNVAKASDSTTSSSGYFTSPAPSATRTQGIHGGNAVDLAASCGTNLRAAAAGTVSVALSSGYNGGYGKYVVIDHDNGSQTLYAHMQSIAVSTGQSVTKGQSIGTLGNTGKVSGATGCHVHFEVHGAKNPF